MKDPTLTPDGNHVIFSYNGDLWKVSSEGGEALRLTGMQGEESLPRVSPNGKWLAFSADQYGNRDIYIMPLKGGEIQQLTFNDASDDLDSWGWDSKTLYFTSNRANRFSGYSIAITGETPKRLFEHYFDNTHNIVVHPISQAIYFNESWESKNFAHRKRYKGDYNPDIKSYNPKTKEYKEYTSYNGKDFWVTIDKNGKRYFVSDEQFGEYNLYTFENDAKKSLTSFKTSIGRPQVSANGKNVVFTKDYQLFLYNVTSKKTAKVAISIAANNTLNKAQDFKISGNISNFDISPDHKKIAFVSRGELFVSDIKGKFIKQLATQKEERVLEVKWLKDNETLLFNQTFKGYANLFTIAASGKGKEKQLTKDARNNVNIILDPNLTQGAYISGRDELRLIDLKSLKSNVLVKDEFWSLYAPQAQFSPDGKYLTYNAIRNFEADVFTLHIPSKKVTNLTKTGVTERNPIWSPDGKYIYFGSNLTAPSYPYGLNEAHLYKMALDNYEAPFSADKFDALFEKKEGKEVKKGQKEEKEEKPAINIRIKEKGLMDRLERLGPSFGLQRNAYATKKGESTYIFYISNHSEGNSHLWKTTLTPFEKDKTEKVSDNVPFYQISVAKDHYYILKGGDIHSLDIKSNAIKKIELSHTFRKNLSDEFQQMFYEAWAGFEENYYDGDFHGENWQQLRKQYATYLPHIRERAHLRTLFNDMLGELNTSHFGFYSNGQEENKYYGTRTLATGIVFSASDPYVVAGIVADGPADVSGKNIRPGDRLIAVNDQKIDPKRNREMYFVQPSMDAEMRLQFSRNNEKIVVDLHPIRSGNLRNLLYDEWVDDNQAYVDLKSNEDIAYIHMKNMGGGELENFKREMVSEAYTKKGLILDLRYNTGGNVHDAVLQFLSQKPYLKWKYRDGALTSQPNFGPAAKPIIILINEQTLSDAEMTSEGFKALGLGKVIGTETYRWIIFTSGNGLVDGSFYRLPSWGCYSLDGRDLEVSGVSPDMYVKENFKDRISGNQPQLDKAIGEIYKMLDTE
ncbi:S41 family peptidase [Spongiimicrobium salis]|uniref:S41 family peptidase n=1 Tax=Spongiimicrobium salis TaxID=1667022 RepID=UPI00374DEBF5